MTNELQIALTLLQEQKGIEKEYVLEALRAALAHAYKKNYKDDAENVEIVIDSLTGLVKVVAKKLVVEDINEPQEEHTYELISLEDAKNVKKDSKPGDIIEIDIQPKDFGRISAQTAKQIVLQKIREAERENILKEYQIKANDIITAAVQRFEKIDPNKFNQNDKKDHKPDRPDRPRYNVILDIGKAEASMPPKEQVQTEVYKIHDRLKVYVLDVKRTPKGAHIVVSRTHADLVKRLFEREVPEIRDGILEIRSIAREPGLRTKMAVHTNDSNVDPVGSCVGNRGARVNAVVTELQGEKIDIVKYSDDPIAFITAALSPAKVIKVIIDEQNEKKREARVIVEDSQLSLAIGKDGQNARLAAKLTGWKIDIRSNKATEEEKPESDDYILEDIDRDTDK